jgi:DNA-binding transcriptional regulator YiaG
MKARFMDRIQIASLMEEQGMVPLFFHDDIEVSQQLLHAIRTALGMSLAQLGKRLGMSPQGVKDIELREEQGGITLGLPQKVIIPHIINDLCW